MSKRVRYTTLADLGRRTRRAEAPCFDFAGGRTARFGGKRGAAHVISASITLRARAWTLVLPLALLAGCGGARAGAREAHAAAARTGSPSELTKPRLIVQITVYQLRADLLKRYADRYGEGGLRRFLEEAVLYENARYGHAITETAVGHATLFTGALPSAHGIVGNAWFEAGRARSSVEDARFPLLGRSCPNAERRPRRSARAPSAIS